MSIRLANMVVRCPHCDVVKRCIGIEDDETKDKLVALMHEHVAAVHPVFDAIFVERTEEGS